MHEKERADGLMLAIGLLADELKVGVGELVLALEDAFYNSAGPSKRPALARFRTVCDMPPRKED